MALYRTDPSHTILYRMHVYRTVRYRAVLESKLIRYLREDHGETTLYRTVPYRIVSYGGMCGRVVRHGTVMLARGHTLAEKVTMSRTEAVCCFRLSFGALGNELSFKSCCYR